MFALYKDFIIGVFDFALIFAVTPVFFKVMLALCGIYSFFLGYRKLKNKKAS